MQLKTHLSTLVAVLQRSNLIRQIFTKTVNTKLKLIEQFYFVAGLYKRIYIHIYRKCMFALHPKIHFEFYNSHHWRSTAQSVFIFS